MKYPRLSDQQDLRRKLMDEDIEALKISYASDYPFHGTSYHQWKVAKAAEYGVSPSTIYYHTDASNQAKVKRKNANAHSKANMDDYENHRASESKRRVERWSRNPDLREWHYQVSAKNDKLRKRKTVFVKPLS